MKCFRSQRGISLIWVVVVMAIFTFCAMALLFYFGYQRNLFMEGWQMIAKSKAADMAHQADSLTHHEAPAGAKLSQCKINGKLVISNTECNRPGIHAQALDVHDTQGFEAPKVPAKVPTNAGANSASGKMLGTDLELDKGDQTK